MDDPLAQSSPHSVANKTAVVSNSLIKSPGRNTRGCFEPFVPASTSLKLWFSAMHEASCLLCLIQPREDSVVYGVVVIVIHFTDGKIEAHGQEMPEPRSWTQGLTETSLLHCEFSMTRWVACEHEKLQTAKISKPTNEPAVSLTFFHEVSFPFLGRNNPYAFFLMNC